MASHHVWLVRRKGHPTNHASQTGASHPFLIRMLILVVVAFFPAFDEFLQSFMPAVTEMTHVMLMLTLLPISNIGKTIFVFRRNWYPTHQTEKIVESYSSLSSGYSHLYSSQIAFRTLSPYSSFSPSYFRHLCVIVVVFDKFPTASNQPNAPF